MTRQEQIASKIAGLHFDLTEVQESIESLNAFAEVLAEGENKIQVKLSVAPPIGEESKSDISDFSARIVKAMYGIHPEPKPARPEAPKVSGSVSDQEAFEILALLLSQKLAIRNSILDQIEKVLREEVSNG